ncbi:MAG: LCP family protein [Ruminococcus sp.]|nr:LCP family protein [Ruminococcus sp.]
MKLKRKLKKKHILLMIVAAIFITLIAIYASLFVSLYKNRVEVVEADEVNPTARKVLIAEATKKDENVINILLVGTDSRDPNAELGRSDTMMVVSYNADSHKATTVSFMRDSLVDIDGYGLDKLGHTYAYGGVGLTINTINKTYGLDIQNYVTINFENLVNVIDELGGIEVNITAEEAEYYRVNGMPNIVEGYNTLTGSQALAHARNRSIDSDFGRTRRQRSVIYGIYQKVRTIKEPSALFSLVNFGMTQVQTNMDVNTIYELAMQVLAEENLMMQQAAIPIEGSYSFGEYNGMSVLEFELEPNKERLQELLY